MQRLCVRISNEAAAKEHKLLGDISFVKEGLLQAGSQYTAETTPSNAAALNKKLDDFDSLISLDATRPPTKEEVSLLEKQFSQMKEDYFRDVADQIVRQRAAIFVYGDKRLGPENRRSPARQGPVLHDILLSSGLTCNESEPRHRYEEIAVIGYEKVLGDTSISGNVRFCAPSGFMQHSDIMQHRISCNNGFHATVCEVPSDCRYPGVSLDRRKRRVLGTRQTQRPSNRFYRQQQNL